MTTLPVWISPKMIELFGQLFQEFLTQQPFGIITFTTCGINGFDNEGQGFTLSLLDLIQQSNFVQEISTQELQSDISQLLTNLEEKIEEPVEENFDWLNRFVNLPEKEEIISQNTELVSSADL
jgi:hypothetical protein